MRGKAGKKHSLKWSTGITPAYAGKSRTLYAEAKNYEDHPRLCGEKVPAGNAYSIVRGSPPPMRGKGRFCMMQLTRCGITPAYAGKSEKARNCVIFTGDHPRLCGEKQRTEKETDGCGGSPPPMRGKAFFTFFQKIVNGDHPRLCGEKEIAIKKGTPASGITPAYAGKSIKIVWDLVTG